MSAYETKCDMCGTICEHMPHYRQHKSYLSPPPGNGFLVICCSWDCYNGAVKRARDLNTSPVGRESLAKEGEGDT